VVGSKSSFPSKKSPDLPSAYQKMNSGSGLLADTIHWPKVFVFGSHVSGFEPADGGQQFRDRDWVSGNRPYAIRQNPATLSFGQTKFLLIRGLNKHPVQLCGIDDDEGSFERTFPFVKLLSGQIDSNGEQ
jgi:hypothetical protein